MKGPESYLMHEASGLPILSREEIEGLNKFKSDRGEIIIKEHEKWLESEKPQTLSDINLAPQETDLDPSS
jgi:hypothetical protein